MLDLIQILDALSKITLTSALALAIWGGMREWYIWRGSHERILKAKEEVDKQLRDDLEAMTEDRNLWRDQAIGTLIATKRVTHLAEKMNESDPS